MTSEFLNDSVEVLDRSEVCQIARLEHEEMPQFEINHISIFLSTILLKSVGSVFKASPEFVFLTLPIVIKFIKVLVESKRP